MKTLIVMAALALSTSAFALDFPSESGWAKAMTARACGLNLADMKEATGEIAKTEGGVIYTVSVDGNVVAAASAKNSSIFAKKTCLN